jgi:hypothetical protein
VPADALADGAPLVEGDRGTARPAIRCSECHASVHTAWLGSGHARSNRAPLYLAMRQHSGSAGRPSVDRGGCDPCHAPLRTLVDPGELAAEEGVTCDVCHTLKDVTVGGARAQLSFGLAENVRRGTICDAQEHYFHKTACSPLFREPRMCAGCHRWSIKAPSGRVIPVLTEYDEWLASPSGAAGVTCQTCHMPAAREELATGWKRLAPIGSHGFMGAGDGLWQGAVSMKLTAEDRQGHLHAEVAVKNEGSGHALPTGFPGRQLVLEVSVLDAGGGVIERAGRTYTRVLVDAGGKEVPFYAAHAEASDSRIAPGETRRETFSFRRAGALRVRLLWRRTSPGIAAAVGVAVEERVLREETVRAGAKR